MNPQEPIKTEDDEISLIDIILFFQASFSNVVKSLVVCLFAGGIYYFSIPKMYEASATISMATFAGELVETPTVLLEKMKLPLYFSPATLQACGSESELKSKAKFVDKINPSVNKKAPFVSFVVQAPNKEAAKACLNNLIAEISREQDAVIKTLLVQKTQIIQQLRMQLEIEQDLRKNYQIYKGNSKEIGTQFSSFSATMVSRDITSKQITDLIFQISNLENELIAPKTQSQTVLSSVYAPDFPANKRPLFTLGLCLTLGVFCGLLVTLVMRVIPKYLLQLNVKKATIIKTL